MGFEQTMFWLHMTHFRFPDTDLLLGFGSLSWDIDCEIGGGAPTLHVNNFKVTTKRSSSGTFILDQSLMISYIVDFCFGIPTFQTRCLVPDRMKATLIDRCEHAQQPQSQCAQRSFRIARPSQSVGSLEGHCESSTHWRWSLFTQRAAGLGHFQTFHVQDFPINFYQDIVLGGPNCRIGDSYIQFIDQVFFDSSSLFYEHYVGSRESWLSSCHEISQR